jgi:hypothetical protein
MAKQQKSGGKETSSSGQNATIIDGDAVEAPAEPSPQAAQNTARRIDADPPPRVTGVARLSPLMPPLALGLSCIALIIAGYALWQTSVTATVSSEPMSSSVSSDRFVTTGPAVTALVGRVDRLDAELAAALAAYKAEVTSLQDRIDAAETTAVPSAPQADLSAGLERRLAALESGVKRALARGDNPPADPPAADPAVVDPKVADSAVADRSRSAVPAAPPPKPSSSGVGLLLASGLLADNLAGQPLTQWIDLLQQHSRAIGAPSRFVVLVNAAAAKPESIPILMRRAQTLQPLLVAALNAAGDDAGWLERVGARLGQLVQLRAASPDQAGNAGAVQAFEAALIQQDFDGVLTALGGWQGDLPDAVDTWRLAAEQRRALDAAVRATVAGLLAKAMEIN